MAQPPLKYQIDGLIVYSSCERLVTANAQAFPNKNAFQLS
jgi:hypothetical protein